MLGGLGRIICLVGRSRYGGVGVYEVESKVIRNAGYLPSTPVSALTVPFL